MLHYREEGAANKETILFLHGGGLSGSMWTEVADRMSDYHCLIPDLPEHGRSSQPQLTMDHCVAELELLLQGRERVHLVGLSLGGAVALRLMQKQPANIKSALISGTAAGISKLLAAVLNAATVPMYGLLSAERLANMTMKSFRIPERYRAEVLADSRCMNVGVVKRMNNMLTEIKLPAVNDKPLLVLTGAHETGPAKRAARTIVDKVPRSKGAIVPESGHVWSYENPELFADVIRQWIDGSRIHPHLLPFTSP
ncbi:alpha/beta hydrolase [Paenibacillaceae bacterium]|nr:alpha/beta hydrolase [Paenibacillaceae bacterium]